MAQDTPTTTDTALAAPRLVSTEDISGTEVFDPAGTKIGRINNLLIDPASGRVAYALMGFGGFLGLGEDEFPLPWAKLRHDSVLGGYVTDVTSDQLTKAPPRGADWYADREWEQRYFAYYGLVPYWV